MSFPRHNASGLGFLLVALVSAAVVAWFFPGVLADPDNYFFATGGDGQQTYFAASFYGLYDHGTRFTGMNYPHGEHFLFPNLEPAVAWGIHALGAVGLPVGRHSVGIINLVVLLGLALGPVVLYAILRRLRLPVLYAVLTALLIGFLSPQIDRIGGHLTLSYICFMPFVWYCIIRIQEAPRDWRWYALFGLSSLVMGMFMIYFLACACFFLLGHVMALSWQQRRPGPLRWRMLVAALLPLILFRGWMWYTDPYTDRPTNPYGLLVYVATPTGLFTPNLTPTFGLWQKLYPGATIGDPESWSYVGLVATLVFFASLLGGLWYVWKRPQRWRRLLRPALPAPLRTGLWAATLLVLLAGGVPFNLPGFNGLIDYFGPLKQLRSLGRFAWPFYYVLGVYAAYYLYRLWRWLRLKHRSHATLRWVGMALLLSVWSYEAWLNMATKAEYIAQSAGARSFMDPTAGLLPRLSWADRQASDFQAIMPLPYFNLGSDKIVMPGAGAATYQAEKLALDSGLPLLSAYVSRPSVGEVLRHVQLLSSDMIEKPLLQEFPSAKPILLVVTSEWMPPAQRRLVDLARLLVTTPEASLYELPLAALGATSLAQERAKAATLLPALPERPGGLRCTTSKGVLVQGFDGQPDRRGRLAPGAFYSRPSAFHVLYDGPVPAPADTGSYEVSVWINGRTDQSYGNLQVKQFRDDQQLDAMSVDGHVATEVSGDWLRVVATVRLQPGVKRLQVLYDNEDLLADDLLIRPLDTDVYYYVGQGANKRLIKNTYVLGP